MTVKERYESAKEIYAKIGVDTDKAIETLKKAPVSLHCWQGDDVKGFDQDGPLTGGIQTTGNYPGVARTPEELFADMDKAMSLMPGTKKINVHASYAIFEDGEYVDRDKIEPKHFKRWVEFAKERGMGLDFNPTFFSHPNIKDGLTLSSPDEEVRKFWIEHGKACIRISQYFAEETGIPELKRTTRDEPDYDKLMNYRINILKEHGLGLKEIQETIAKIDPMPGAKEFLDELREITQVIIISDTFTQFAGPLMKKLGYPTIFCNSLEVAEDGEITGFKMRIENSKLTTVKALQSIGYDTIASGDSHNDLGMIKASKAGFLFRSTDEIKKEYPELPAFETYDELMAAIKEAL